MEIIKAKGQQHVVVFVDLKKAFDKVRYWDMFELLMDMEIPKDIIEILWKIYEEDQTTYKINNIISDGIEN